MGNNFPRIIPKRFMFSEQVNHDDVRLTIFPSVSAAAFVSCVTGRTVVVGRLVISVRLSPVVVAPRCEV